MHTSTAKTAAAKTQVLLEPAPENFLAYHPSPRRGAPKEFDGHLSNGAFAVLVLISIAIAAIALLY